MVFWRSTYHNKLINYSLVMLQFFSFASSSFFWQILFFVSLTFVLLKIVVFHFLSLWYNCYDQRVRIDRIMEAPFSQFSWR